MVQGDTRSSRFWVDNWVGYTQSIGVVAFVLACVVVEGAPTVKSGSGFGSVGVEVYD